MTSSTRCFGRHPITRDRCEHDIRAHPRTFHEIPSKRMAWPMPKREAAKLGGMLWRMEHGK